MYKKFARSNYMGECEQGLRKKHLFLPTYLSLECELKTNKSVLGSIML